jgi:hypothetical protein
VGNIKWSINNTPYKNTPLLINGIADKTIYTLKYIDKENDIVYVGDIPENYTTAHMWFGKNSVRRMTSNVSERILESDVTFHMESGIGTIDINAVIANNDNTKITRVVSLFDLRLNNGMRLNKDGWRWEDSTPSSTEDVAPSEISVALTYGVDIQNSSNFTGTANVKVRYAVPESESNSYVFYVLDKTLTDDELNIIDPERDEVLIDYTVIDKGERRSIKDLSEFRFGDICEIKFEALGMPYISLNRGKYYAFRNPIESRNISMVKSGLQPFGIENNKIYINTLNLGYDIVSGGHEIGDIDEDSSWINALCELSYVPDTESGATNAAVIKGLFEGDVILTSLTIGLK